MKLKHYALHLLWVAAAALVIGCQGEGSDGNGTNGFNSGFTNGGATNGLTASDGGNSGLNGGLDGGGNDGGGNGGLGQFNVTFSNVSGATANTEPLTNPASPTGGFEGNQSSFYGSAQIVSGLGFRSLEISLINGANPITTGSSFIANRVNAIVTYSELDFLGGTRTWRSTGGTVSVTGINNGTINVQLEEVAMVPFGSSPGTGTFNLGGPAYFIITSG